MSAQTQTSEGTATGTQTTGGAMPPQPPTDGTATGSQSTPPADRGTRDANSTGSLDREDSRDANLAGPELERAIKEERKRNREMAAELTELRNREKARADAEKTDVERLTERAETAERELAATRREMLARQVANEAGIPQLWHRLAGDDVRALRADAGRMREEMGLGSGALEGGVRSDGLPNQPQSMDDLIRGVGGARR